MNSITMNNTKSSSFQTSFNNINFLPEPQQQPSTSSQPLSSEYSSHVQESFRTFMLSRNSDADENDSPNNYDQQEHSHSHDDMSGTDDEILLNVVDSDDGYSTPTEYNTRGRSLVPESEWVYSTPQRPRHDLVCPGAPKRKKSNSSATDLFCSNEPSCSHSLPSESSFFGPRGISKPRKHRKTSPSAGSRRRSSFPNIRLDFSEGEQTNHDQGQMSSF